MISRISTRDVRYPIGSGHGSDAIHKDPVYSYAITLLHDDCGHTGSGLAFTLGDGNDLVCRAAEFYARCLLGGDIEEIMAGFGALQKSMADEQQFRWLGPHKGVVHLALASVTNACWDLWAKKRGLPLWKLLLDLTPEQVIATLDLSYLEDELTDVQALSILRGELPSRSTREGVLTGGYPGYDTSVGWFNYADEQVRENCKRAINAGFTAMKLKVGSSDPYVTFAAHTSCARWREMGHGLWSMRTSNGLCHRHSMFASVCVRSIRSGLRSRPIPMM